MESTLHRKEGLGNTPGYTNGGGHIPLGSEGSSKGSEGSSGVGEGQLPDTVEVTIVLPDNTTQHIAVDYGKQMMDLLVQVTASNKLSPATHTFQLYSEETGRPVDYYASQTVGAVGIPTFHVVQKKSELQRKKERQRQSAQPFETTHRLTVNLPKNQKMLTRVSPKSTLAQIYKLVCTEKNLDPYKYELRHPTKPDEALNMARPLGDYGLVEITVVSVGPESRCTSDFSLDSSDFTSPVNTSAASSSVGNTLSMEKKKRKGILSLFSKRKEGKFKPNEATYTDSNSTLPSNAGKTSLASSCSFTEPNHHQQRSSNTLDSKPSTSKTPITHNNNVQPQKTAVPSKPPRKKRQAPLPPTARQPPPPGCASSTSVDLPQDPLAQTSGVVRSRTSSHSSGFESAGSPGALESPRATAVSPATGDSLRASRQTQPVVRPKQQGTTSRKKRAAPAPPGVSRLRLGSDGSAPSSDFESTPASTPRLDQSPQRPPTAEDAGPTAGLEQEGSTFSISRPIDPSSLPESPQIRPRPIFMAPPPPETPPPPRHDLPSQDVEVVSVPGEPQDFALSSPLESEVVHTSTQVHVNVRDSLSSAHSRSNSTCSNNTLEELALEFDSVIDLASHLLDSDQAFDPVERPDPGNQTDLSVFTEQMSSLTENLEDRYTEKRGADSDVAESGHLEKEDSFTKDSLHDDSASTASSDSVSVNAYDFGHVEYENEPALPDLDNSVVLVKQTSLIEDSFHSETGDPTAALTESQDSGVSTLRGHLKEDTLTQINNNNDEKLMTYEEVLSPIDFVTHSSFENEEKPRAFSANDDNLDRFSVDSLDMINSVTPTSDSGFSGSLERNTSTQDNFDQRLSVTEEIMIDQSEVMYIAPGGPKPEIVEQKSVEKVSVEAVEPAENSQPLHTEVGQVTRAVKEEMPHEVETGQVTRAVKEEMPHEVQKVLERETENCEEQKPAPAKKDEEQRTVFIIEKTKLNQDLRNIGVPEPPKEKRQSYPVTSVSATLSEKSLDPDYRKFLTYVDSAKQKTGEVCFEVPKSPDSKGSGTAFFVDIEESKPHKQSLHSQSLDSFSNYSKSTAKADPFGYSYPEKKDEKKSDFKITTLQYKPEAKAERISKVNSLRDVYHRPVGKSLSQETDVSNSRPKSMYSSSSAAPSYSFYKTEVRTQSPKRDKDEGKRSSTVILMRKDDKTGQQQTQQQRRSGLFMGPRPYGARKQTSEPSVRDVRKALSIYEAKVDAESISSSKDSDRGTPTKDYDGGVRERCTKLGFSPSGEQEHDSVLEEKSISQIALPAQRKATPKKSREQPPKAQVSLSFGSALQLSTVKSDSMENLNSLPPKQLNKMTKSTESVFDAATPEKSKKTLESQYDDLQQQFSKWQTQLLDNQSALNERAPKKFDPDTTEADSTLATQPARSSNLRATCAQDGHLPSRHVDHRATSEFNRRSTIDVVEHSSPMSDEAERRGRIFENQAKPGQSTPINTRLEELKFRRHQGARYSSLTEGVPVVASNAALGSQFSTEELSRARIKLRQNSAEEKNSSTRFNADGSSSLQNQGASAGNTEHGRKSYGSGFSNRSDYRNWRSRSRSGDSESSEKNLRDDKSDVSRSQSNASSSSDQKMTRGWKYRRDPIRSKKLMEEPKLDPREELMIAVRSAGGRTALRQVTVDQAKWT